jgi:hypothetical protein
MKPLDLNDIVRFIEDNIGTFHAKRLDSLQNLKLRTILKRKNLYLFKAKNILTAQDIVKGLLDAHLSSQEETIFGEFLEQLAIFICGRVYGGRKSAAEGIDLEFERDNIKYVVTIKSGPHWGNSGQIKDMKANFKKAKMILHTNAPDKNIVAICGCGYGRDNKPDKGEYLKYCGQKFWELVSGNEFLYTEIIKPLGHRARERNEQFLESYSQIINKFTMEFANEFCIDGRIDWEKLVKFNSSIVPPARIKKKTAKKKDK